MKKRRLIPLLIILLTVLLIIYSDEATEGAISAMKSFVTNILPSLFPYMVISSMLISSGASVLLGKIIPVAKLFKLPECASISIILGALCGFPLGARCAVELYESGYLSKAQAEILISTANNTGPTFIIFVIGKSFWNSIGFGTFLYFGQLITAFISSIIVNRIIFPVSNQNSLSNPNVIIKPILSASADAIKNASVSCLCVCGFISFFASISAILNEMLSFLPTEILCFFSSVMEFSEASRVSAYQGGSAGAFLCGLAIGWSGISVLCQTASFTANASLSLKRYVAVKLIEGLLLGLSSIVYSKLFTLSPAEHFVNTFAYVKHYPVIMILLMTAIYIIYLIKKRKYA